MIHNHMMQSRTTTLLGILLAGFVFCSPALARQSRVSSPAGTNAKAPATKTAKAKTPAVTTSKTAKITTSVSTSVTASKVVTATTRPTTPIPVVPAKASEAKTVVGTKLAGKTATTTVATIARPAADSIESTTPTETGEPKGPSGIDIAIALANMSDGKITAEQLARQLAGPETATTSTQPPSTPVAGVEDYRVVAQALPAITESARFKAWTWGPIDRTQTNYMVDFAWFARNASWMERNPATLAATLNARPQGERVVMFWDMTDDLARNPLDNVALSAANPTQLSQFPSPWMDNGIATVRTRIANFIASFVAAGGNLDAVILDNETDLLWHHGFGNRDQLAAIERDPRFPQLAEELGFSDLDTIAAPGPLWTRWNEVMGRRFDAALETAVYDVVKAAFPNVIVSNYESFRMTADSASPWCTGTPDLRQSDGFGTHETHSYYGIITASLGSMKLDGVNPVGIDPFSGFRLQVHRWRACDNSSNRSMQAWIPPLHNACDEYDPSVVLTLQDNPFYTEMVLHFGVQGCETFLYWNSIAWKPSHNPAEFNRLSDQKVLDSCLRELNETLGQNPGAVVPSANPGFGDQVVASGRRVGDRVIWRFTFAPGIAAVEVKFVDGTTQVVTAEPTRPGAWFSYPASKSLRMNAAGTAPEMVIAPSGLAPTTEVKQLVSLR